MRRILGVMLMFAFSLCAVGAATAALNDEQWSRFYARYTGQWRSNPAKSTYLTGNAPKESSTFRYTPQPGGRNTRYNDDAVHILDGRENPLSTKPNPGTVAREVLDEFTVGNTLRRDGRITSRNTFVLSPDGDAGVFVMMSVDERGKWTINGTTYYEKVK